MRRVCFANAFEHYNFDNIVCGIVMFLRIHTRVRRVCVECTLRAVQCKALGKYIRRLVLRRHRF